MYIFQIDRYLLDKQIGRSFKYISGDVLDVGAGVLRYKQHFSFKKYLTLDVNKDFSPDIVGSAEDIPLDESSLDSIVCTQVLEHLPNPDLAIKEFCRVLKPNGIVLLTAPQLNELHEEPNDFYRYTKYGLKHLFVKNGFDIIQIEQRGGFFSAIGQMYIRFLIDYFGLYKKKILGRLANYFFILFGRLFIYLDEISKSKANKKHTIGYLVIARKK